MMARPSFQRAFTPARRNRATVNFLVMCGRFTITRRDRQFAGGGTRRAGGFDSRLSPALQRRADAAVFHRQDQIRKSRSDSRDMGARQERFEGREHGGEDYQRALGDGRDAHCISRRVPEASMRRAGRWLLRMDGAEDRASTHVVPSRGQRSPAIRRPLRGVAERAGRLADDLHDSHDRRPTRCSSPITIACR